jgi:CHAD domain-containing protein
MGTDAPRVRSERGLLGAHLRGVVARMSSLDPLVRSGADDAVHRMRVQARKLRSTLHIFRRCFDHDGTAAVRIELAWFGETLGGPRDLEVLADHLEVLLGQVPSDQVRPGTGAWLRGRLLEEQAAARRTALEAMDSERYAALQGSLTGLAEQPPWAPGRDRAALERLPKALGRALRSLDRSVVAAARCEEHQRTVRLHVVRKRAKKTRYAAEVLEPVLGAKATRIARDAERVQTVLGSFHDAVVAADHVRRLADLARADRRDTATFAGLQALLEVEQRQQDQAFARLWGRARLVL